MQYLKLSLLQALIAMQDNSSAGNIIWSCQRMLIGQVVDLQCCQVGHQSPGGRQEACELVVGDIHGLQIF